MVSMFTTAGSTRLAISTKDAESASGARQRRLLAQAARAFDIAAVLVGKKKAEIALTTPCATALGEDFRDGAARIREAFSDVAELLESLHDQTVALMNEGATLDTIIHEVKAPPHLLDKPYLRPTYDDPEFVVRNVWRLYGGWWDGDPASLRHRRCA